MLWCGIDNWYDRLSYNDVTSFLYVQQNQNYNTLRLLIQRGCPSGVVKVAHLSSKGYGFKLKPGCMVMTSASWTGLSSCTDGYNELIGIPSTVEFCILS